MDNIRAADILDKAIDTVCGGLELLEQSVRECEHGHGWSKRVADMADKIGAASCVLMDIHDEMNRSNTDRNQ